MVCELSCNAGLMRSRALQDGRAAGDAVADKHRKYPLGGASLVAFALEAGGRPSDEVVSVVRRMAASARADRGDEAARAAGLTAPQLWQELALLVQFGNAEIILTANGR